MGFGSTVTDIGMKSVTTATGDFTRNLNGICNTVENFDKHFNTDIKLAYIGKHYLDPGSCR